MEKAKITVLGKGTFDVDIGTTIIDALKAENIALDAPCGGGGKCGKCKVVARGAITSPDEAEAAHLSKEELSHGVRLGCRAKITGDCTVQLCAKEMKIETGGALPNLPYSPICTGLGVAVDVGTTTVAVYLCDLDRGEMIGVKSFKNPQSSYGADVITRAQKIDEDNAALRSQQKILIDAINSAVARLCDKLYKSINQINICIICGNTIMQHIAAGIDPTPISKAPFTVPTYFENYSVIASSVGLDLSPNAVCAFAPCLASYIGGDISCGIVAAGIDQAKETTLFLDVGTNGEIALSHGGKIYLCSAAAGPAFEGAHIECGMPGTEGAISHITYDGAINCQTIGGTARGICGSGLIDAVAIMIKRGIIDEGGAFSGEYGDMAKNVDEIRGNDAFFVADNVYITGKDVREVQLAKAAICAGINIIMKEAGISARDVGHVVLAGGFGSHLDGDSIKTVGLIPRECGEITFAGNTAGVGAVALLMFEQARQRIAKIRVNSIYVELSNRPDFMDEFMDQMAFDADDC
ncbi:MAG: DUF4445 domain-containing protein [Clostridia bacterium]|nr:DUF4445 domain-containing protein [Clostridia bacterium]